MFINESFLSFVWQFQYFDHGDLSDLSGSQVTIIAPGFRNNDSGPDFSNSVVRIGEVTWHGFVEIHVKASDWLNHRHDKDPAYDNVILHVVWEDDGTISRTDGTQIPALELKRRIHSGMLHKFHNLVNNTVHAIPCAADLPRIDIIHRASMLESVLIERVKEKSEFALSLLDACGQDWEEASYRILFMNFGFKINKHPMMALATYLPFRLIKKHSDNLCQIEALLYGTAGFLQQRKVDEYYGMLTAEYTFLKRKYGLHNSILTRHQWKFMRTHPANFPTLRLAQLASFLHKRQSLFGMIRDNRNAREIYKAFKSPVSEYWKNHYDFGKQWMRKNSLGKSSIYGLIINTCLPVLGAYGIFSGENAFIGQAIELLSQLPQENNRITRVMENLGFDNSNSGASQALIQLHNKYCIKRKCLDCKIGVKLLQLDDFQPGHSQ
jgi:hypothetical protein